MFKGLKSKLEDEAKKLQASVQQYSEQFSQQVEHIRGTASDAGSEGGSSITRRFLSTVGGTTTASPNGQEPLNLSVGNALMEEVAEGDLLGLESSSRQRRLSGGSTHSTESSLSTLFQSVPGLAGTTLDTVDSDNETISEYGSGVIKSASKDQISNVLSRLQGRASTYKDKYRELVKKYNDVVTENNKCRTVLSQTQDKALERIEKLRNEKKTLSEKLRELEESRSSTSPAEHKIRRYEEMLEKCKVEISKNRAKIKELSQENEKLSLSVKAAGSDSDVSTLVADRVANEWKQRINKVEEEWTERMNKNDTDHAIQLATTKADMHAALETKDKEIESWRSRCRTLEIQDGQANERWQKKVEELQQVVQALEAEKSDMIEKLSAAKLQGVKAVRDEEEKKREELLAEFSEKEHRLKEDYEAKIRELESEKDEEIMQLRNEIETTRFAEKSSGDAQSHDQLIEEVKKLRDELSELEDRRKREVMEMKDLFATAAEQHRCEVAELMQEHDEILSSTRKQQLIEMEAATSRFELAREEADSLRVKNDLMERQLELLDDTYTQERIAAENVQEALQSQLEELREKLKIAESSAEDKLEQERIKLQESYIRLCECNDELKKKLEEETRSATEHASEAKRSEETLREELRSLQSMLDTRNAELHLVELRKQELEDEIAAARELSAMHEHLKAELEITRKQRDDVSSIVASLTERAEKAEKALEEDRARLKDDQTALEKLVEERKERDCLITLSSERELGQQATACEGMDSFADLSSHTAGEISTSDELQQLRAEIAHLNEKNAQLAAKIENNRLNEVLKENMEEIEAARLHRAALEKELFDLKALYAERCSSGDGGEVLIPFTADVSSGFQKDDEVEPSGRHIDTLEKQLQNKSDEIERLNQVVVSERGRAEEALDIVKQKMVEQETRCTALMNDMRQRDAKIIHLEEEVERVRKEEEAAKSQFQDSENHCRELETRIDELILELDRLHAAYNEERARAGSELTQLQELQSGTEAQLGDLAERLRTAEQALLVRERDLETARTTQEEQARVFESEISGLKEKLRESSQTATEESERSAASLREVQETLHDEEKRVSELLEKLEKEESKLRVLQSEAEKKEDKLKFEIKLRQDQDCSLTFKVRELEELNDKMRLEFLAKEEVIAGLREEIDKIHSHYKESVEAEDKKLHAAQQRIVELNASEKEARNSLLEMQVQMVVVEEKMRTLESTRQQEKVEEERIREQYANALENLKTELAEAHSRISHAEAADNECERLKKELDAVKKQCEDEVARHKEESQASVREFKLKAEKKIVKLKAAAEQEVTSAKAELLLEMDELRRTLTDRDRRIDDLVVEKARTEQKLLVQEEMVLELEQRRVKEKELNDFCKAAERRIMELEAENRLLEEKNNELLDSKEKCEARAEQSDKNVQDMLNQIKSLQSANEEGFRKAVAKHDSDNKKAVRELQREVKHLYVELNEKTDALDAAHARISELESSSAKSVEEPIQKQTHADDEASSNYGYEEELESMRRKLKDCHREVDGLRDENSRLERLLEQRNNNVSHNNSPAIINVVGGGLHEGLGFADPAEAEYLKNVLYRYMASRENLGKESVTLARVIGTVARFSKSEMENVITREESRVAGWVGGTVSHVLSGR